MLQNDSVATVLTQHLYRKICLQEEYELENITYFSSLTFVRLGKIFFISKLNLQHFLDSLRLRGKEKKPGGVNMSSNLPLGTCHESQFQCANGKCVDAALCRCDLQDDCGDDSDEVNCSGYGPVSS